MSQSCWHRGVGPDASDGGRLELRELVGNKFAIPPLIVFVDDILALPKKVEQRLTNAVIRLQCYLLPSFAWPVLFAKMIAESPG